MILAASDDKDLVLVTIDKEITAEPRFSKYIFTFEKKQICKKRRMFMLLTHMHITIIKGLMKTGLK